MSKGNRSRDQVHKTEIIEQTQGMVRLEAFSGLLPHPELLRMYEELQPGMADRIMRLAESENAHRNEMEKEASKRDDSVVEVFKAESQITAHEKARGQWLGFALTASCIAGALWTESTTVAVALCTAGVGNVLGAFLGKRREYTTVAPKPESSEA